MLSIARRNLLHDKLKLATALTGVVFSVVLSMCSTGLYVACSRQASSIIDNAGADIWITASGTRSVDLAEPISTRRLYQALAVPGVLWAEPLLVRFARWRLPDGRQEITHMVGLERDSRLNLPWGMSVGDRHDIRGPNAVIIDERERTRFGSNEQPLAIGDRAEIFGSRARVAGFSRGVASITTAPYVFTTHKRAKRFTPTNDQQTTFVVAKCASARHVDAVRDELQARLAGVEVLTADEFSRRTRSYWLFGTGIGACIIFTAVLGLVVGCLMVSQTVYASTMSRIAEYGTLKALGMGNLQLARIVLEQAWLLGLISFALGSALGAVVAWSSRNSNLSIDTPLWLFVALFVVTLSTCTLASITSVAKVFRLPPASVFRS